MEQMEILLNEAIKNYKEFLKSGANDEERYSDFLVAIKKIEKEYNVDYKDRDLLKALVRYTNGKKIPIHWIIENWYKLTNRKMRSIRLNWLRQKNKVEADGLVFNDYYEEDLNEVHRAKLDQDGYDVTEQYASDSV